MYDSIWKIHKDINENSFKDVFETDYSSLIIKNLSFKSEESFFSPTLEDLYDPFLLPDMDKAVDRILEAVDNGEKIAIYGDYDVDGITAVTVLYDFLKKTMEADVYYYLPNRFDGGYGLTMEVVESLLSDGISLVVTVDNGISADKQIEYAISRGIDVVVTDHHEIPEEIPNCSAVVDPLLPGSSYPNKYLCGCSVSYKLCEAIAASVGLSEQSIYLPLVALATIADVMPLIGENRSLTILGLREIGESAFPGLNLIIRKSFEGKSLQNITAGEISFSVSPKINSAGRVTDPVIALKLFLAETEREAEIILNKLDEFNNLRKELVDNELEELRLHPELIISKKDSSVVVIKAKNWNLGINGVIAPRITGTFGKACLVMSCDNENEEDPIYKASGRSIDGINLIEAISGAKNILEAFGGHEKACGFSIRESKIPEFTEIVEEQVRKQLKNNSIVKNIENVFYLPAEKITLETINKIAKLEPFGEGFRQPIFITDGIESLDVTQIGQNKATTRFVFGFDGGINVKGISFDVSKYFMYNKVSVPLAVVYTLSANYFNGKITPQINVIDIIEGKCFDKKLLRSFSFSDRFINAATSLKNSFVLSKGELSSIYLLLKSLGNEFDINDIGSLKNKLITANDPNKYIFTWFKVKYSLQIFNELGLISIDENGKYQILQVEQKKDITGSIVYNELQFY